MRGYRTSFVSERSYRGSIPADAGLPEVKGYPITEAEVYPRGCGATNIEWFKMLLDWFEDHYSPVRDFLPLTANGDYHEANSGDLYAEGRFYPYVSAQKESYEESVAADEQRTHEVTLNATKAPDSNANAGEIAVPGHGATVVNMDDQTGWPDGSGPKDDLTPFKDDAYTTSKATS